MDYLSQRRAGFLKRAEDFHGFSEISPDRRSVIADRCFVEFCSNSSTRKLETWFCVSICFVVAATLCLGYIRGGFLGALLLCTVGAFLTSAAFALVVRRAWARWIRRFVASEEFKSLKGGLR